ncbi:rCG43474 [Rattus norvegicus]|uniref:RCG43474 n=1 Tax=Rattus norvegicus TaxID=10116 RepID=A6JID7_RAT|nr:rCG43474 [Rattus norvegicus]
MQRCVPCTWKRANQPVLELHGWSLTEVTPLRDFSGTHDLNEEVKFFKEQGYYLTNT